MKTHKKVKITERYLRSLGACNDGIKDARRFLRTPISTNPEENVAVSLRLWADPQNVPIWWLSSKVLRQNADYYAAETSPWGLAQVLAMTADKILAGKGR